MPLRSEGERTLIDICPNCGTHYAAARPSDWNGYSARTLRGLTQFPRNRISARPQTAEYKQHRGTWDLKKGFALHCPGPSASR